MLSLNRLGSIKTITLSILLMMVLSWGLMGCSKSLEPPQLSQVQAHSEPVTVGKLVEVAPPEVFTQLRPLVDQYQPQVSIVHPKPDQVLQDTTVQVELKVQDLPLFKATDLEIGPHLHLFLDNELSQDIYAVDQPVILENLTPGTHTIRIFASRPWHESFKNEGAYAQTTFHIFTKTQENTPDPKLPLLSYNQPQGDYGAEPILLDFYLTNAPLHLVAQEKPDDDITDWKIRITVNGQSFLLDDWQALYLKGFNEGNNWVQLQLLDEKGNPVKNAFNNTVRLITYHPKGQDPLSKLVRGELSTQQARAIVDPNFKTIEIEPSLEDEKQSQIELTPIEVEPSLEDEKQPLSELTPIEVEPSPEDEKQPLSELTPIEVEPSLEDEKQPLSEITPVEDEKQPLSELTPIEVNSSSKIEPEILTEQVNQPVETQPIQDKITPEIPLPQETNRSDSLNSSKNLDSEPINSKSWKPQWLQRFLDSVDLMKKSPF